MSQPTDLRQSAKKVLVSLGSLRGFRSGLGRLFRRPEEPPVETPLGDDSWKTRVKIRFKSANEKPRPPSIGDEEREKARKDRDSKRIAEANAKRFAVGESGSEASTPMTRAIEQARNMSKLVSQTLGKSGTEDPRVKATKQAAKATLNTDAPSGEESPRTKAEKQAKEEARKRKGSSTK